MLADAIRAEGSRLIRQRGVLAWAFGFVPAFLLLLALAVSFYSRLHIHQRIAGGDIGESIFRNINDASAPPTQLFVLLAAAAIFAGDYRWETWRLLTPRNNRPTLMLGKLAVYGLACAAGLSLLALSGALQILLGSAIDGSTPAGLSLAGLGRLAVAFVTSWLDLMLLGEAALVTAVLTRSNIATVMVPFGLFCVQAFLVHQLMGPDRIHPPLKYMLSLPSLSVDVLRGSIVGPLGEAATGAGLAGLGVALWLAGLGALGLWLFQRQDLTRE